MIHAKKVNTVRRKKITNTIAGKVVIIDKTTVATKIRFLILVLCQEKVQTKSNHFSHLLRRFYLLF